MAPIRVLQVVGVMDPGGVETWLMHVLRHIDHDRFHVDFLVHTDRPGAHDAEIRSHGSRVLPCLHPSRPLPYARALKRICREHGPYQVVHSHVHQYSGYVLRIAYQLGIPIRIAHSHTDTSRAAGAGGCVPRVYRALMSRWISRYASLGLAASRQTAVALFGPDWETDARRQVLYCGVDLQPFADPVDGAQVRAELGIPPGAFVLGHVGSFTTVKNHAFLLDVAQAARQGEAGMRLLLVGDGPLRGEMERLAAQMGLRDSVIFAGTRPDVPRVLRGAVQVMLLPSLREGLPLVGIEAQAAGIPIILSDSITGELDVVEPLVRRLSLQEPPSAWACAALAAAKRPPVSPQQAFRAVQGSDFNIRHSIRKLQAAYAGEA